MPEEKLRLKRGRENSAGENKFFYESGTFLNSRRV